MFLYRSKNLMLFLLIYFSGYVLCGSDKEEWVELIPEGTNKSSEGNSLENDILLEGMNELSGSNALDNNTPDEVRKFVLYFKSLRWCNIEEIIRKVGGIYNVEGDFSKEKNFDEIKNFYEELEKRHARFKMHYIEYPKADFFDRLCQVICLKEPVSLKVIVKAYQQIEQVRDVKTMLESDKRELRFLVQQFDWECSDCKCCVIL